MILVQLRTLCLWARLVDVVVLVAVVTGGRGGRHVCCEAFTSGSRSVALLRLRASSSPTRRSPFSLSARDTSRQKTSLASSISVPPPPFSNADRDVPVADAKQSSSSSSSYVVSRVVSGNRRLTEEEQKLIDACFGAIDRDTAVTDEIQEDWKRPIFLFDGICNFCSQSVSVCYDWDIDGVLRFAPLQSPTGRALLKHFGKAPDDLSSLVLVVDRNTAYFESDAVLQIASRLGGLPPILKTITKVSQFVPRGIRNKVYHVVADRRYLFGEADGPTCRVDLNPARFVDQVTPEYEI